MAASIGLITRFSLIKIQNASRFLLSQQQVLSQLEIVRHRRRQKHWDPKWRKERTKKVVKIELPKFDEMRKESTMTPDEIRLKMKEKGITPSRPWMERPINVSSTAGVFEQYVPPEGDGKVSPLTTTGAKQKLERVEKKTKSMLAIRKIRSFDEDFQADEFAKKAQEIYINVHKYLSEFDEDKLHELVTEKCYPGMVMDIKNKTVRWAMLDSLEPPRVVHARCASAMSKDNVYAQVTVRIHTRQTLAVYDRFGRLMNGSEVVAKDVLEYVVFEKHMSDQYGLWRVHAKIVPSWAPPKEAIVRTFRKPPVDDTPAPPPTPPSEEVVDESSDAVGEVRPHPAQAADRPTPAVA